MPGKMLKLVREAYSKVKATVRTKDGLTKLFDYTLGVSSRLFIIFINELESLIRKSECRGISIANAIEIFQLMYADDIVLSGDAVLELQRKIGVLEEFCEKWGTEVNLTKTKVIVFRNRGLMFKSEKFDVNLFL